MSPSEHVVVREAAEEDARAIRDVFEAVYGPAYPYRDFYDTQWLKRSIFTDDVLTLVAEVGGQVVGTASIIYSAGALSDLVGEFGRLAVHPDARGRGIGKTLMRHRIEFAERRLHAGIIENRTAHPFSQRIALDYGFLLVGFLPLKHSFRVGERESVAIFHRLFGSSVDLRKNHPRVIPEAHTLAHLALARCELPDDLVVDEAAHPYPSSSGFISSDFTNETMGALLRIERGRVAHREVYGPIRLHYGFFKISARNASYIVAHDGENGPLVGAIGYLHDEYEQTIRIFELIARSDDAPRYLFEQLVKRGREWGVEYLEVDVSAHAPRMQRTLVELGFMPAAYVPALVFVDVERVDIVKMVRLMIEPDVGEPELSGPVQELADVVMAGFLDQSVLPQVEDAIDRLALFDGLGSRQSRAVASLGRIHRLAPDEPLFADGGSAGAMFIVLDGRIAVRAQGEQVGAVSAGESIGEVSMLTGGQHTATAVAVEDTTVVAFDGARLDALVRRRPDIGLVLYRNLARGLGDKLRRVDKSLVDRSI